MDINKIPMLGKVNKSINAVVINFILLGVVFLILGVVILFFPQVLDFLVSALLIVSAAILFNIAYRIHSTKKKYTRWLND